jgi:hypothetical protein
MFKKGGCLIMPVPKSTIIGLRLKAAQAECEILKKYITEFKKISRHNNLSKKIEDVEKSISKLEEITKKFNSIKKPTFFSKDENEEELQEINKAIASEREIFFIFFSTPENLSQESKETLLKLNDKCSLIENYFIGLTNQESLKNFSSDSQIKILKKIVRGLNNEYKYLIALEKKPQTINKSFNIISANIKSIDNFEKNFSENFNLILKEHTVQLDTEAKRQLLWLEKFSNFIKNLGDSKNNFENKGFILSLDDAHFNDMKSTDERHSNPEQSLQKYPSSRKNKNAAELVFNFNAIATLKMKGGEEKEAAIETIQKAQPKLKKELSEMLGTKPQMEVENLRRSVIKKYDPNTAAKLSAEQIEAEVQAEALAEKRLKSLQSRPILFFDAYAVATNRSPEKINYQQPKSFEELFVELSKAEKKQLIGYHCLHNFPELSEYEKMILIDYRQLNEFAPISEEQLPQLFSYRPPKYLKKLTEAETQTLAALKKHFTSYKKSLDDIEGFSKKINNFSDSNKIEEKEGLKNVLPLLKEINTEILNNILKTLNNFSSSIRENIAMYLYDPYNSEHTKTLSHLMSTSEKFVATRYADTKLARSSTIDNPAKNMENPGNREDIEIIETPQPKM